MKNQYSTLTTKGQITIPVDVRNKLHLSKGSKLEFIISNNSVVLVPINQSIMDLQGALPKPAKSISCEEMNDTIKERFK